MQILNSMKIMKYLGILLLTIILISCDRDFTVETSPTSDFNLFFKYLKNDYAYRDAYSFTMEELRQKYLPEIKASDTQKTLATLLISIINELKDPHLYFDDDSVYRLSQVTEYKYDNLEKIIPVFSEINIIRNTSYYVYGTIKSKPNVGYIYIRAFNDNIGGTDSLGIKDGVKKINDIIKELNNKEVTKMIIDIRSDAGGSNYVPRYIAQRFIDKTAIYMIEQYPEGSSFIRKEWIVEPAGTGFRTGKIALLSNGQTASGGEMFLLAMLQRDNIVHIGSTSAGAAGNIVTKDLSNGWDFTMTNSKTEFPDGKQYFKVGITPSIVVKNDNSYGYTQVNDKLIEKALDELQ